MGFFLDSAWRRGDGTPHHLVSSSLGSLFPLPSRRSKFSRSNSNLLSLNASKSFHSFNSRALRPFFLWEEPQPDCSSRSLCIAV